MAVHGWLILPIDQEEPTSPEFPVAAWFVHHTPEFWTDSPHNFQIILYGFMIPLPTVQNLTQNIAIPYPPSSPLLVNEFTITPPGPFSLNDLLAGKITEMYGVVYNGSFDTSYERYALSVAKFFVQDLTTAVYLNISDAIPHHPELRYYSYPRTMDSASDDALHLYLSHQIHSAPDFDHVVHASVPLSSCSCAGSSCPDMASTVLEPGALWVFPNTNNSVDKRLHAQNVPVGIIYPKSGGAGVTCKLLVVEELHCVVGPGFFSTC